MPKAQYQWQGATYEVHALTTIDQLNSEQLAIALGGNGGGRYDWVHAYGYAKFVMQTKLIAGTSRIPMLSPDSPYADLLAAKEIWLSVVGHLDEWRAAASRAEMYVPEEEQANLPNGSTPPPSDESEVNTSSGWTPSSPALHDPLST